MKEIITVESKLDFAVSYETGEARMDSRLIAERLGIGHSVLIRTIKEQKDRLETFGILGFKNGVLSGAGQPPKFVMLNEDQCYFLATLSRNTEEVVNFKAWLVRAFRNQTITAVAPHQFPQTYAEALRELADAVEAKEVLRLQNETMQPKAEFYDAVTGSSDTISIREVAKVLNMGLGQNKLFEFLRNEGVLMSTNEPYQKYVDLGYFRMIESTWRDKFGDSHTNRKTVVFQKGIDGIRKLLNKRLN